ncbi:purine permease [Marinomonas sp. C2222]|uniref:Purine permease n=1 Tax=Marinomonas sargassi TaxID=2984494 RepID=A0ABT2YT85_9GAMM|nr:nucleobase:cation symporter-2 family protein [Marinomonas sargassi]MCV2403118.1 purine permease [Marinomonas sargassi]
MSEQANSLVYQLDDVPPPAKSLLAATQHVLASIVGIATPSLIVGGALGLGGYIPYLIAMAFFVSGIATFIQCKKIGPIGSGMLSVQGTSFAFLGAVITAGFAVKGKGGTPEDILSMIFGLCLAGSLIEILLSQYLDKLKRIITPTVTGIVITVIGLSLTRAGFTDFAGGARAGDSLGEPVFLLLGFFVVTVILIMTFIGNPTLRISAIMIGLISGTVLASFFGLVNTAPLSSASLFAMPLPFKFGLDFDFTLFLPIAFLYLVTAIETSGDLTANSVISGQPVSGDTYLKRIKGGVLGDGVNSAIAAVFNTFPNTTFSQNNGVIQMTGVASRHVGMWVGGLLFIMGLFPIIGSAFLIIPKPVLGGATLVLFATIAVTGIRILASQEMSLRTIYIIAVSLGLALGVTLVPNATQHLPALVKQVFSGPITVAGLTAIVLTLVIPEEKKQKT